MTYDRRDDCGNLLLGVNEVADANNPSGLERKHIPAIKAPETVKRGQPFHVRVTVGAGLDHPSEHKHFIQAIELYADRTFLARVDLTAVGGCPKVTFCVSLGHACGEIRAYARCNLHGTWLGKRDIVVT